MGAHKTMSDEPPMLPSCLLHHDPCIIKTWPKQFAAIRFSVQKGRMSRGHSEPSYSELGHVDASLVTCKYPIIKPPTRVSPHFQANYAINPWGLFLGRRHTQKLTLINYKYHLRPSPKSPCRSTPELVTFQQIHLALPKYKIQQEPTWVIGLLLQR